MIDPIVTIPAFAALETAINLAVSMAPEAGQELESQQGKTLRLRCHSPDIAMIVELGEKVRIRHDINSASRETDSADAGLEGDLQDWLALARAEDKASELINGDLKLSGNSKWLLQLGQTVNQLDVDWEGQLANLIGDVPATLIGRGGKFVRDSLIPASQGLGQRFKQDLTRVLDTLVEQQLARYPGKSDARSASSLLDELQQRLDDIQRNSAELLNQSGQAPDNGASD